MASSSKKGSRSTTFPIALPHDGPLSLLISQDETLASYEAGNSIVNFSAKIVDRDEASADACIFFFLFAKYGDKETTDVGLFSEKVNFLHALIHASHLHEQLRALQKFRNKIIQNQYRERKNVEIDSSAVMNEGIADRILYRILLEWMISAFVPVTLRRAVASCLSVLLPHLPCENDDDDFVLRRNNILVEVLDSILQSSHLGGCWQNPLHSLDELLSWVSIEDFFKTEACITKILKFLQSQMVFETGNLACDFDDFITLMANLINKVLILSAGKIHLLSFYKSQREIVAHLQRYLWNSFVLHDIPIDRLSNVCIAYGRTVQFQLRLDNATSRTSTLSFIFERVSSMESILQRAALLQGLAVVVPIGSSVVLNIMVACRRIFVEATNPDVRGVALKGVRTLVSRIYTFCTNASGIEDNSFSDGCEESGLDIDLIRELVDETLHVVLQAWENPPTRKLANAIPALFENLIQLSRVVSVENSLDELIERLLNQAPNVKCRYLALEVLLPITGAGRLVKSNLIVLHDLLMGIGDQGHNTSAIADLWANLLKHLYLEYHENDSHLALSDWLELWSPSLICALSSKDVTRRKQVAAFCLPRIFAMELSNAARPTQMAPILHSLLSVEQLLSDKHISSQRRSGYEETIPDRMFWVELEIIRYAAADGLLKTTSECTRCIRNTVAAALPKKRLQSGLVHDLPTIRIAALQVMGSVVGSYSVATTTPLEVVQWEMELWMFALPSLVKTGGKENILSIHQCLLLFLDRLLLTEVSSFDEAKRNQLRPSPLFLSFVVDFLISDILLKKTGYPGTVALKESFLLSLMECLIVYSYREHPLATESKILPKNLPVFRRRRLEMEEDAIDEIRKSLCSSDVLDCLTTLLYSTWDSSRAGAYRILLSLFYLRSVSQVDSKDFGTDSTFRQRLLSKGIFLASSPRQREADTGAKLISLIYISFSSIDEKRDLLASMVDLLDRRLACLRQQLAALLCFENHARGPGLPLAHGIVQALRLIAESHELPLCLEQPESHVCTRHTYDQMISLFFRALRVSLAVVADVNLGQIVNGMDEEIFSELEGNRSFMMVNPSAIGANGIFSSVKRCSSSEISKRLTSQRIVIGSWLLTKETCAAIASVFSLRMFIPSASAHDEAGMLLISTLTALKHTGAAFAAHRALQRVAQNCFSDKRDPSFLDLPNKWGLRMIAEVSDSEKIRNSILRRSTGFSLGFLALLRADVYMQKQHACCHSLLLDVMRLCLPSSNRWNEFASKMHLSEKLKSSFFPFPVCETHIPLVLDSHFNLQARVHALNVLRSCLLDSPIANEVLPYVGFAFIAAVIGYTDSEWSVRNSSTMVFAAAMLRSIDPDKNSSRTDVTGRNTITADELFRSYPPLAPFLLAVLNGAFHNVCRVQQAMSLPPVLPILLLLSRIQPISQSGDKSVRRVEPFFPIVLKYLSHNQMSIRKAAARAIRNMVSDNKNSPTFIYSILVRCQQELTLFTNFGDLQCSTDSCQWNYLHGVLLTIQELALYFPLAKSVFWGSNLLHDLYALSAVCNGALRVPCSCAMVAIEIIWLLSQNHDCSSLILICKRITSHLEYMHQLHLYDIGAAELGAQVSSILTTLLSSALLQSIASSDEKSNAMKDLSQLLHADCIDLQFASVKKFKKILHNFIDCEDVLDAYDFSDQFGTIAEALNAALHFELHRSFRYGPHPPTLRRISRCLIDWIDIHQEAGKTYVPMKFNFKFEFLVHSLFQRGSLHLLFDSDFDPICMSQLYGNALEMLSLKPNSLSICETKLLGQLIKQLSNPSCPWRVRLSVASSLGRLAKVIGEDFKMFSSAEMTSLLHAYFAILQDEDFDVRQAASRATMKLICTPNHIVDISNFPVAQWSPCLPLPFSHHSMVATMFLYLYFLSDNVEANVKATVDNLIQYKDYDCFPTQVNETFLQVIFETENPNSYMELCVQCQLIIVAMVTTTESKPFHMNDCDLIASTNAFLKGVYSILTSLQVWALDDAIISNVTYSSLAFPCLHNVFITTLTLIYFTGESFAEMINNIQSAALGTISLFYGAEGMNPLHPLLFHALDSLLHAKQCNLHTLKALKQCCFLVSIQDCK